MVSNSFYQNLKDKSIFSLVFGAVSSRLATTAFNAAMALYVLDLTGQAKQLGFTLIVGTLPFFLLSLLTGIISDRYSRKAIIIFFDSVRVFISVAFLLASQYLATKDLVTLLYTVVFMFSLCEAFVATSFSAIVPDVVSKSRLVDVNNILSALLEGVKIGGPMLGVLIYSIFGFEYTTIFTGVLFALSILIERNMNYRFAGKSRQSNGFFGSLKGELSAFTGLLTKDIRLSSLYANGFTTSVFLFPFTMVGLPFMVTKVLGAPAIEYGYIEGACGAAGMLAAVFVPMTKSWGTAKSLLYTILAMALSSALFLLMTNSAVLDVLSQSRLARMALLLSGFFAVYLAFSIYGVYFVSFQHETVPSNTLGKSMSIVMMLNAAGRILGLALFGYLFDTSFIYAIYVFVVGMFLKIVVHIPFMRADRARLGHEVRPKPL